MTRNDKLYNAFWANFESVLDASGIKFSEFSRNVGISYHTLMGWKIKGRVPDLASILLIAEALDCSIDKLVGHSMKTEENRWRVYNEAMDEASAKDLKVIRAVLNIAEPEEETALDAARILG